MNDGLIDVVFSSIMFVKKSSSKLHLDDYDRFILRRYYDLYDVKNSCPFKTYKNLIIEFSIVMLISIHKSCEVLTKEIIK
jgi:hypothetical protein